MNIIVIDAIFDAVSVLAYGPLGVYSSTFYPKMKQRGRELQKFIDIAVHEAGFAITETNIIALPEGPGGFTGLRLGYAAAKAISLATGAVVLAIPTLTILDFSQKYYEGNVVAAIEAKHKHFYVQAFNSHNPTTQIYDEDVVSFLSRIDTRIPFLVVGIGVESFKIAVEEKGLFNNVHFIEVSQNSFPKYVLEYVLEKRELCKTVADSEGPIYIRKSDAERDLENKDKQQ